MNIVKATRKYEEWLGHQLHIVAPDLELKHQAMARSAFSFLRATFYRWVQLWEETCVDLEQAPRLLSVGDLHVENFGTWRDTEGRLIWGVNDFDEACVYPYTMDLVRLVTSALMASREKKLAMKPKQSAEAILTGYRKGMEEGGLPFVLGEEHGWLRAIAESKLRDPVVFWRKLERLPTARGLVPESARDALEHMLPEVGLRYRLARRVSGLGSLGRVRLVAIADWQGGQVAREAKALVPSAMHWLNPRRVPAEILYGAMLRRAVRCPDPHVELRGHWIVRRLSPNCSRIELDELGNARGELRLLDAMGRETANIHAGTEESRRDVLKDLRRRKGDWLANAAHAMTEKLDEDWKQWRERRRSRSKAKN